LIIILKARILPTMKDRFATKLLQAKEQRALESRINEQENERNYLLNQIEAAKKRNEAAIDQK